MATLNNLYEVVQGEGFSQLETDFQDIKNNEYRILHFGVYPLDPQKQSDFGYVILTFDTIAEV